MKKLLVVLSVLLVLAGCSANQNDVKRVGVIQLVQHDALDKATQGFVDELKNEFGDGIEIEVQNASGESANCNTIATNFVAENVDLILGNATPALLAASHATDKIPVLGTSITEYGVALQKEVVDGIVGGNVSGTSDLSPLEDQANMIVELFPDTKTVSIIYCSSEANSLYQVQEMKKFLNEKNIEVREVSFSDSNDVQSASEEACDGTDVLYVPTDNTCASNGEIIKTVATKYNVPIITGEKECCLAVGGIATLSIDYYVLGQTTGKMAIRILNGEDISKMPIEFYPDPVKLIDEAVASKFNVTVPSDYESIK